MNNEINKELSEISPFMSEFRKNKPELDTKAPAGYFEQLPDIIIEKAKATQLNEIVQTHQELPVAHKKRKTFLLAFQPMRAIAATFLLVAGSWFVFNQYSAKSIQPTRTGNLSQVQNADLNSFISDNIEDYDLETLLENGTLSEDDLNLNKINLPDNKADSELKKYLKDNFETPDDLDL